jgi:hypothetical protein
VSLERDGYNGPITFCCDECGEIEETRCAEFSGAMAKVKAHGWRARSATTGTTIARTARHENKTGQ